MARRRSKLVGLMLFSMLLSLFLVALAPPPVALGLAPATPDKTPAPTASRPAPATSNSASLYFPETGHYLLSAFRLYWQSHGALAQFGYPLTEEFLERNPSDGQLYTVQYFERNRFEYHPEKTGTPYEVELGLLGAQAVVGRQFDPAPSTVPTLQTLYFPETGHSLQAGFKRYWERNGGLAIYGYPLSEEISEGGYIVQYFQRARFEYHPENAGTPYEVLLGLLGTSVLQDAGFMLPQIYRVQPAQTSVVQGRTLRVTIFGAPQFSAVSSRLAGTPLTLTPTASDQVSGFAAVPSDAPLKPRSLQTDITDLSGTVRHFEQTIGVSAGQFEQQLIELSPEVEAGLGSASDAQRERERDYGFYKEVTPQKLWEGRFSWPTFGPISTSFGARRNYVGGGYEIHDGIDIGVPARTVIRAPAAGRVVLAEFQKVRGGIIIIDHGLGLHTGYFHQSVIYAKVGQTVKPGDVIGLVGTTGLSTGPHLHWEMRIGETGVDPEEWIKRDFS